MMVQRIGKSFFLTLLTVTVLYADPQVSVQITDSNGYEKHSVGVGVPFLMTVEVSGESSGVSRPKLEVDRSFALREAGTSSRIRTVNGQTSVKKQYLYEGRIDRQGTYTVGPVHVEKDGDTFSSQSFELEVTEDQAVSTRRESAFLKIDLPKQEVFWGEKIPFSLRFYYANNDVRVEAIEPPHFNGFKATVLNGPRTGKETIDGVIYRIKNGIVHCIQKRLASLLFLQLMHEQALQFPEAQMQEIYSVLWIICLEAYRKFNRCILML